MRGVQDFASSEQTAFLLIGVGIGAAWSWWACFALGVVYLGFTMKAAR